MNYHRLWIDVETVGIDYLKRVKHLHTVHRIDGFLHGGANGDIDGISPGWFGKRTGRRFVRMIWSPAHISPEDAVHERLVVDGWVVDNEL